MSQAHSEIVGICPTCHRDIRSDHPYSWCSECGKPLPEEIRAQLPSQQRAAPPADAVRPTRRVQYRVFESSYASWSELFAQASAFASGIPEEDLISISHSADNSNGVVAVWFWSGPRSSPG